MLGDGTFVFYVVAMVSGRGKFDSDFAKQPTLKVERHRWLMSVNLCSSALLI